MAGRNAPLAPFVALAHSATGPLVLVDVVNRALGAKDTFLFGELLDVPAVGGLAGGPQSAALAALELFAYGTYADYVAGRAAGTLPELGAPLLRKLRLLTVATAAAATKVLTFDALAAALGVAAGEVEEYVVAAMDADLVTGKLDQRSGSVEVVGAIGRDVRPDAAALADLAAALATWRGAVHGAMTAIDSELSSHAVAGLAAEEHKAEYDRAYREQKRAVEVAASNSGGGAVPGGGGGGLVSAAISGISGVMRTFSGPRR